MTFLATRLIWTVAQITLLWGIGGVVYLVVRRRGPETGAQALVGLLGVAIVLPALALTPWPSWSSLTRSARENDARDTAARASLDNHATQTNDNAKPPQNLPAGANKAAASETSTASIWIGAVWTEFRNVLQPRAPADSRWRWPDMCALVVLAGAALAVARLVLGLLSVGRLYRGATPVDDDELHELLQAARRRFGCRTVVELRQSAKILAPATIGWRRAVVLLPENWQTWTAAQRRAVIAHEVAHVARQDYAGWIVAQLSVALHFYHPLAHWLTRRLRLEQELAADACGALAVGGSRAYLTVLAQMTLNQNDRRMNVAARPFLSTRGTLHRRIEMLRDSRRSPMLATRGRWAMWGSLLLLGLLLAGVRGPAEVARAADESPRPPGAAGDAAPLDVRYLPDDVAAIAAARPAKGVNTPFGQAIVKSDPKQWKAFEESLGLSPADVDVALFATKNLQSMAPDRIILRATKAHDWSTLAAKLVPNPQPVDSTDPRTGKRWFKSGNVRQIGRVDTSGSSLAAFYPDDRTVIFAPEADMPGVVAASVTAPAKPKWAESFQAASQSCAVVMVDVAGVRKVLDKERTDYANSPLRLFAPLWQDAQLALLSIDGKDNQLTMSGRIECTSPEAAERVERTSQALVTMAQNALEQFQKTVGGNPGADALAKTALTLAHDVVTSTKLSHDGAVVKLTAAASGESLKATAMGVLPALDRARSAARRAQSMNNLKQIALAMHIYLSEKGHFPAATVIGPDGKTPHSWRVEILPYVEGDALYKQYKLDEPWDSPANKKVLEQMPAIYRSPSAGDFKTTDSSYAVLTGPATMFPGKDGMKIEDITGGTSNTIMIVTAPAGIPWTKPEDVAYDPAKPLPKLGDEAAFADGSVRNLNSGGQATPDEAIREMIEPKAEDKAKHNGKTTKPPAP